LTGPHLRVKYPVTGHRMNECKQIPSFYSKY
jgi:hypothetical protein